MHFGIYFAVNFNTIKVYRIWYKLFCLILVKINNKYSLKSKLAIDIYIEYEVYRGIK